ncbi:hypothetical protein [Prauserella endophytica]|uniref:AMP-dependent synthetase/ligase domain-containing protein n=1 Tax=Prauserella endophytica TaxID=1592324 RepID=A0ABY2S4T1_9PSEU|nr:hypothetical protein [Prauserella endophytica]TKG70858.1 hypothetical protein FCN18_15150 [Prauserella endophytica]
MTGTLLTPSRYARESPDAPAIVLGGSGGEVVTFAQLHERSVRFAAAWAAQRSGLYYTAIDNHLRPGEAQYVLDDCGASAGGE